MYDEPFHVPEPDEVILEERWAGGEWFRSGMRLEARQGPRLLLPARPRDLPGLQAGRAAADPHATRSGGWRIPSMSRLSPDRPAPAPRRGGRDTDGVPLWMLYQMIRFSQ